MKTIFTKLAIGCSLVASQLANAQAPLLPLFENNTIKWGATSYYKGNICDVNASNSKESFYETTSDTLIKTKSFKVLSLKNKNCSDYSRCGSTFPLPTCATSISQKYVVQNGNLITEVNRDGMVVDTLLYFQSTQIGSLVILGKKSKSTIISIDTILFGIQKIRKFNLGSGFAYVDGIGFDDNGPFSTGVPSAAQEISSALNCFSKNGASYSMERTTQGSRLISSVKLVNSDCQNPLGFEDQNDNINNFSSIFINQNYQLETSQTASSIEIFNSKGQKVLQNKDAFVTDISSLPSGFYVANITFANKQVKHKFLVNN